jgi:hypothetical protein
MGAVGISKRPVLAMALAMVALAACTTLSGSYVVGSTVRGPFIDATLATSNGEWRFLFPPTETCVAMLRSEAPVTYSSRGSFGRVVSPDASVCHPVGVGTLDRWRRSRQPGEMTPSSPANWTIIHEDPEVFLLRGRFPVASRLGLANTFDVVAMVPPLGPQSFESLRHDVGKPTALPPSQRDLPVPTLSDVAQTRL